MNYAIDTVKPLTKQHVVVSGWIDRGTISMDVDGRRLAGMSTPCERPDLVKHFGEGSRNWGFVSLFHTNIPIVIGENAHIFIELDGQRLAIPKERYPIAANVGNNESHNIFLKELAKRKSGSLVELGSRARSGNTYRHLFPKHFAYTGIDIMNGPNVDIVADVHDLPDYLAEQFDFAYSVSTFEHLLMPWKAALEMNKILKSGGIAYIQSHASWPIHEEPWDYFRFSKYSWHGLFNVHTGFEVLCTNHGYSATIVPDLALGGPLESVSSSPTYLLSACIVQKHSAALASWPYKTMNLMNLNYNHE